MTRPTTGSPSPRPWPSSQRRPVVAAETDVLRAHDLATAAGYAVSVTGSAGLAGLLTIGGELRREHRVIVIMSGVAALTRSLGALGRRRR